MKRQTKKQARDKKKMRFKRERKANEKAAFIKSLLFRQYSNNDDNTAKLVAKIGAHCDFSFHVDTWDPAIEESIAILTEMKMSRLLYRRYR